MTIFCPSCGKPNPDEATSCATCGAALKGALDTQGTKPGADLSASSDNVTQAPTSSDAQPTGTKPKDEGTQAGGFDAPKGAGSPRPGTLRQRMAVSLHPTLSLPTEEPILTENYRSGHPSDFRIPTTGPTDAGNANPWWETLPVALGAHVAVVLALSGLTVGLMAFQRELEIYNHQVSSTVADKNALVEATNARATFAISSTLLYADCNRGSLPDHDREFFHPNRFESLSRSLCSLPPDFVDPLQNPLVSSIEPVSRLDEMTEIIRLKLEGSGCFVLSHQKRRFVFCVRDDASIKILHIQR